MPYWCRNCRRYVNETASPLNLRKLTVLEGKATIGRGYERSLLPYRDLVAAKPRYRWLP